MSDQETQQSEARGRVLNAAYGLFLQNGLAAVSMQQIAAEAGITKATLYHHCRDKHDLYLSTMRLAITRNENALNRSLAGTSDLRGLVQELITYLFSDERADLQRLASDFRLHVDVPVQEEFWQHFQLPWRLVQSALEGMCDISEERTMYMARYIYGAASGLSQLYRFEEDTYPITGEVLEKLVDTILYGLTPSQQHQ